MSSDDTIHALASGAPPSGVAVIRVSGPNARRIGETLTGRVVTVGLNGLRRVRGEDRETIDEGLVLFFAGPSSFTGEDVLELQVHGSRAVVQALDDRLTALGSRPAEPGKFTRRAFENGRMDLTEIEGLSDLLAAQTETQRRLAVAQQGGTLRALYEGWAEEITRARAMIEAELDFADEEDVPDDAGSHIDAGLQDVAAAMAKHLENGRDGEIVREGFRIALLGPPNAGKSSLLNALVQRDAAIVTDIPGTTRDAIEVTVQRKGMALVITDTAGMRETDDVIEAEGIRRAQRAAVAADLRVWLSPDGSTPEVDSVAFRSKDDAGTWDGSSISTMRPDGLDALWAVVDAELARFSHLDEALPTRARHRRGVADALENLKRALTVGELELRAEHLRSAAHALGTITGRVDVEDLLGVIFAEFCVGK